MLGPEDYITGTNNNYSHTSLGLVPCTVVTSEMLATGRVLIKGDVKQ